MAKVEHIKAEVKPELLIWARESAGLRQKDAAKKAHVMLDRLEEWESGDRPLTINQLCKLADLYKRPLGVFFLAEPPSEADLPPDFRRMQTGVPGSGLSFHLRLAIRKARLKRAAALELSEELGESIPRFAAKAQLTDDVETVAKRLRDTLGVDGHETKGDARQRFNFCRGALERAGVLVLQAEKVDPSEMRGFSISERPLPVVVVNIKDAPAARSFSVFHEMAHILLGAGGLCDLDEDGGPAQSKRVETFCNRVAAATLVPREEVLKQPETPRSLVEKLDEPSITSLAKRFGVSKEAILLRLVELKRLPSTFYLMKRDEYRKQTARPKPAEGFAPPYTMALATSGRFFSRLVLDAYAEEKIGPSDVLEMLGVRLKHLKKMEESLKQATSAAPEEP